MKYEEYRDILVKRRGPKKMKVTNSWGVYDAYKLMRKNKWYDIGRPLKEKEFYAIIRGINNLQAEEISKGNPVHLPHGMGIIELRKMEKGVSFEDGKLKNTYPIDWSKTMRLWYEDKEAEENKTLVRIENKEVYYVKYNKYTATYKNQSLYEFVVNRFIKLALKENIKKGKIDALW